MSGKTQKDDDGNDQAEETQVIETGVPAASAAPGWYEDPNSTVPGGQRYWDGSSWTGKTAVGASANTGLSMKKVSDT